MKNIYDKIEKGMICHKGTIPKKSHLSKIISLFDVSNSEKNMNHDNKNQLESNFMDYKEVFEIKNPSDAYLPVQHPSSRFVFAREDRFFAYPNNFNHYVNYYKNTFQHGGVSLEEIIIPYIVLNSK